MTTNVIAIFAWLGGALFCGILPLGFAAVLYFSSRKRGRVGAQVKAVRKSNLANLNQTAGLLRVQGQIAAQENAIVGPPEQAVVYLRLKAEIYISDSDESGWRGMTDKALGLPFTLGDGYGVIRVNPDGLDKHMLGAGFVPTEDQAQAACVLLGISTGGLHNPIRYHMWELRAGQTVSVVGAVGQGQNGLEISRREGLPFMVSPLLGEAMDANLAGQAGKTRTWTFILGIPGAIMLVCSLGGALFAFVRALTTR